MAELDDHANEAAFLCGGGASGALIAKYDWASTPLGPLNAWPQCLKTVTAILLRSPAPMLLLWGDHGVMIYNDAYAKIAGSRHPHLLGAKLRDAWPENAEFGDRVLKAVLAGETLEFRDQQFNHSGEPVQAWFNLNYSPVLDESGRVAGVLAVIVETTDRVLAERKTAAQAEQQRRMFEQAPGFIAFLSGPDLVFEFRNEAHRRLFGHHDAIGKAHSEVYADLDPGFRELLARLYATGERHVERAKRILSRKSPEAAVEELFIDLTLRPVTGDQGEVIGIFIEGFDVTEQVRAQAAEAESERRLSAAVSVARLGAFEWDLETGRATLDGRAREIFGFEADERLMIADVIGRIDIDDVPRNMSKARAEVAGGRLRRELEYRIHLPDGSTRNVATFCDILEGPDGQPRRVIGVFVDVTERKRAAEQQRLLINELNHRVKNTLATVQSIAVQTLRSAPDLLNAREAFEARLVALAGAHDLLTAQSWRGAGLGDVAAAAMAPFETMQRPQISRSGPPVWLTAQHAIALSLALHELATNAAKYGALSRPEGRVALRWSRSGQELTLTWIEEGGPPVTATDHSGFGTRLLQRSLAQELRGSVAFDFASSGVRCEIKCQVEDIRPEPGPAPALATYAGS